MGPSLCVSPSRMVGADFGTASSVVSRPSTSRRASLYCSLTMRTGRWNTQAPEAEFERAGLGVTLENFPKPSDK